MRLNLKLLFYTYVIIYLRSLNINVPLKVRRNGTYYLYAVLAQDDGSVEWREFQRDGPTVIQRMQFTDYQVPRPKAFNLLGTEQTDKPVVAVKPVTHFKNKVYLSILTDSLEIGKDDIPAELGRLIRVNRNKEFLPIMLDDTMKSRLFDFEEVTKNTTEFQLEFNYSPIGVGRLRLLIHIEHALGQLMPLGFSKKDIDEVKGVFSDTNVYLLCGTILIGSIHVSFLKNFCQFFV